MHAGRIQDHQTPSSVGALMDPAFLRGAVLDADGDHPADTGAWPPMPALWTAAFRGLRRVVAAVRGR